MAYPVLADVVVAAHFAFVLFVGVGSLLAWRWPWLVWLHALSVLWALAAITVGVSCPLTPLEKELLERGGEDVYAGGFVDQYIEDVVYPDEYTWLVRTLAAAGVVVGYLGLLLRRRRAGTDVGRRVRDREARSPRTGSRVE